MAYNVCDGRPADLERAVLCLDEVSKNVEGKLSIVDAERHECRELDCLTLTTEHVLQVKVDSHQCDSELGRLLDGRLTSKDLTTVFVAGTGLRRGFHNATFVWRTSIGTVQGRMHGMTNEGTHRKPAFQGCQECGDLGVMEGRLCGRLRATDPKFAGLQVTAAYRIAFDPNEKGGEGGVIGTLEGLAVRNCAPAKECIGFTTVGTDVNPRTTGILTIETSDQNGPTAQTSVVTFGATTGLHVWFASRLTFAQPVSQVEVTLVHFSQPAKVSALDAAGSVLSTVTMAAGQQIPETLVLTGAGITTVVIDAPQDETLLTQVCWVL